MQKITPCLWYDTNAEDAVSLYTSIFAAGKVLSTTRYPEAGHEIHGMAAGTVLTQEFEIEGFRMMAMNGGPQFTFTPAISFIVNCPSAEEVQTLWNTLSEGEPLMPLGSYPFSDTYGWLRDRFGLTWQLNHAEGAAERSIVPAFLFTGERHGKAEDAMHAYVSVFKDSSVGMTMRYGSDQAPEKEGTVMYGEFTLAGQKFAAMESAGEHAFTFNEAVSLVITCEDQYEIDCFWENLSAVPESEMCGWLKDAYGVSWQVVPQGMERILNDAEPEKAEKAMSAILKMKKIDIVALKEATVHSPVSSIENLKDV
jgi:predicted 3-demethylubiquinone-9 3-methyltransferase (glyoxalase superfamily)